MFARLPISIDPYREADRKSQYSGEVLLSQMKRLAPSLQDSEGTVKCDFELYMDEGKKNWVKGSFSTVLTLECQRCMKNYQQPLAGEFLLRVVKEKAEAEVAEEGHDPLIVRDGQVVVLDMIEEEVLLAIPSFPKHEEMADCHWHQPALDEGNAPERKNPFAALETLKKH